MFLRFIVDVNKVKSDDRNLLTIEGLPKRVNSTFEPEYEQNFKAGKYLAWTELARDCSYCKVSTTVYYPEEMINTVIEVLKERNFHYLKKMRDGFQRDIYWIRIAESQYNEVLLSIFNQVKKKARENE